MKATSILFGLPLLCMACGSPTTDDANDAAGTGDPYLAKEVVGVYALTPDARYMQPDHYMSEEFVRSNFKLEESVELKETAEPDGISYQWGGNEVGFTFGHYRPFPTIYAAETAFNERYQPGLVAAMDAMPKKPYTDGGPLSQGLANEWPRLAATAGMHNDTTAANDSSTTVSHVTAAEMTKPASSNANYTAIDGVGDKAVWEPAKHTLHVLYSNNIVSVQVKTKESTATQQQRAASIANVILGEVTE